MNKFFRVMTADGKPTGHVGFVSAKNEHDLFWTIDEFIDPFSVEIKSANFFGMCIHVTRDIDGDEYEDSFDHFEWAESLLDPFDNRGWKKPEWKGYPYAGESK